MLHKTMDDCIVLRVDIRRIFDSINILIRTAELLGETSFLNNDKDKTCSESFIRNIIFMNGINDCKKFVLPRYRRYTLL